MTLMTMTILMAIPLQTRADDIPINETTFPDENFRNWVLAQDFGQDGVLTEAEIAGVTQIRIYWYNIADLKGIEYFTALTELYCSGNQLTLLNVSQNTALTELWCEFNKLTSLDVSKNTALRQLNCYDNQLTSIDVSQNTALWYLNCSYNQLTSLDVSQNTALTELYCYGNQINETEMGNLVESLPENYGKFYVKRLNDSDEQNVITIMQVAAAKAKGWTVYASDGAWVEYDGDVSAGIPINSTTFPDENFRNWVLAQDYGQDGVLTEAEIAGVTEIVVSWKNITNLKGIAYFTALMRLVCAGNQLTSLDVSKNTALWQLECYGNQISKTEMGNLVESLPTNNGYFYVKDLNYAAEQNAITTAQVAAAKAKGWKVFAMDGDQGVEYDGETSADDIPINETTFPDEIFRNWVLAQDYGQDGVLTEAEIFRVTGIGINWYNNIVDLKGIEYFTELTRLFCEGNQLTSLDVSQNTALTELRCGDNQLTSLDVSKNTALTYLDCSNNLLTSLDVSQNTALSKLWCYSNQLTSLDVSKNTALTEFQCDDNQLTSLDVSKNTALTLFYCNNNQLTSLDVSQNTALTDLRCAGNQLTSLDVSKNTALTSLSCGDNQLTSLDVSKNTALTWLDCGYNQLTSLDVSKNTVLATLDCQSNQLTSLDVSKNTVLATLNCGSNQLTSLDVSKNTALLWFSCYYNQLISLDVSKNTTLWKLDCRSNLLTSLDLSQNTALGELWCDYNQLTSLDVSKNTALATLTCGNNQINETEMGKLVESMPANNGSFYVKRLNDVDEQNVITTTQVAAAKAKGWKVYALDSNAGDYGQWVEYDGDEPTMEPIDTADFGSDIDEGTDLDGNVVGDILYNISSGDGSYNATEGCIVVTTPTDDSAINGQDIFGEDFQNNFTGIVFKVPAGKGTVKIEAQTTGTMVLKVKIGNSDPVEMELEGRLKVSFPYNVSEPTYVYIYGGSASAAPGMAGNAPATGELKLYGIEVVQGETGIESLSPTLSQGEGAWYTLDGRMLQGEPSEKGLYIHRGRKVVIK